jgi:hypothetical protein
VRVACASTAFALERSPICFYRARANFFTLIGRGINRTLIDHFGKLSERALRLLRFELRWFLL